jgi:hypothetical protein
MFAYVVHAVASPIGHIVSVAELSNVHRIPVGGVVGDGGCGFDGGDGGATVIRL